MVHIDEQNLQEGINFKLLDDARKDLGWSYEKTGIVANIAEGTVKNVLRGTTENPGSTTLKKLCDTLGVPIENVLAPKKSEIENKGIENHDASVIALKEIYELQIASMKETNELHTANIRAHYEQHHEDLKDNYEKRLADKREIIDMLNLQIAKTEETHKKEIEKLEKQKKARNIVIWILASILIILFFGLIALELLHPEHGWLTFRAIK